jgi:hypothetical protein
MHGLVIDYGLTFASGNVKANEHISWSESLNLRVLLFNRFSQLSRSILPFFFIVIGTIHLLLLNLELAII